VIVTNNKTGHIRWQQDDIQKMATELFQQTVNRCERKVPGDVEN